MEEPSVHGPAAADGRGLSTLDELVDAVARMLSVDYGGAPTGRVRDLPNQRAVRWYVTRGLVDPPIAMRGRQALYGRRHVLQLVAIKRLQAEGLSLAAIQARLAALPDTELAAVARPEPPARPDTAAGPDTEGATARPALPQAPGERIRFWAATPTAAAVPPTPAPAPDPIPLPVRPAAGAPSGAGPARGIRLAAGVFLVLDTDLLAGSARLTDEAVRTAAAPLVHLLLSTAPDPDSDTGPASVIEGTRP